jgi:hypothetical protein
MAIAFPAGVAETCFSPDYATARARFVQAAARAGARLDTFTNSAVVGPDNGALTTDVAVLGPDKASQALLIISGTHGPEGFAGSAAQIALLDELATSSEALDVRVVLVHAVNPWGFAHIVRTTENGVDLNRNFIDWSAGPPTNPLYPELYELLYPADWRPQVGAARPNAALKAWIERVGQNAYVDAAMKGQYTHPGGSFYGGTQREWSNLTLESIVSRHLSTARKIALIDWHTGLGERGEPFFLCFNERSGDAWQRACNWWGADRVESQGGFEGAARPKYTGLLFDGIRRFAAHAEVTGAVIEFGTLGNEEMNYALQIERYLNRAIGLSTSERDEMSDLVREAFSPASLSWQRSTLTHAVHIQQAALAGLRDWG